MIELRRPQDYHPDLTEDRLSILGEIVASRHNSAIRSEQRDQGDRPWSTGCRAYDRVLSGVQGGTKKHPWLTFQSEGSLSFWLSVGQCPMRICRPEQGVVVRPREENAIQKMAEQLALQAPGLGIPANAVLRIEKQIVGRFVRTILLNLVSDDNETLYKSWPIWQENESIADVLHDVAPPAHDPGRASVSPKRAPGTDNTRRMKADAAESE